MNKLKLLATGALILFAHHSYAGAIDVVQTFKDSRTILVSEIPNNSLTKRLGSMPNILSYTGSCKKVAANLRRQVACLKGSGHDQITLMTPSGALKTTKETTYNMPQGTNKEEISIANLIYKEVSRSNSSPFDNRLAFISKKNDGTYALRISLYDGSDAVTLHESSEPLLSPSWSPNGRYLTYVSFESVRASIFVHDTITNKRIKALTLKGLNAYPSFETDSSLLVSISNEKRTSEIHRLNLLNGKLTKLKSSNRADIFPRHLDENSYAKVGLSPSDVPYGYVVTNGKQSPIANVPLNAISVSVNGNLVGLSGKNLVFMKRQNDKWGKMKTITTGKSIESPSISADGSTIYYSIEEKGSVFIKAASINGKNILSFRMNDEDLIQISAQ